MACKNDSALEALTAGQAPGRGFARMRLGTKLGYASGALMDGVANQAANLFIFFYVTSVCGLPPALAGLALAAGLVVDALADPLIGSVSDGWRSRFGRRLPFIMIGAPLIALFLVLIFTLPTELGTTALFLYLTMLSTGLRISISLFQLPYNAVGAELSDDYTERSSIAAWRWGFAMIGTLIGVVLGYSVFLGGKDGLSNHAAYTPFAATLAAVGLMGVGFAIRALLATRERQHPAVAKTGPLHINLIRELGEIFRNPSFKVLFGGALLLFTSLSVHATLGLHANTYFWRMTPLQIQAVTLALFGGLLFGAPLAGPFLKRMQKRTVLLVGILGLALAFAIPTTLRLIGLFPFQGRTMVAIIATTGFFGGALMAAAAIAFASMMADAADEHEHLFGARREGLYFAGWAFASKAAAGFGALVSGLALQAIGFNGVSAAQGAAKLHVSAETASWIGLIYGPGASLLSIAAALTCLLYRLDAEKHAHIMTDLNQRRLSLINSSCGPSPSYRNGVPINSAGCT